MMKGYTKQQQTADAVSYASADFGGEIGLAATDASLMNDIMSSTTDVSGGVTESIPNAVAETSDALIEGVSEASSSVIENIVEGVVGLVGEILS